MQPAATEAAASLAEAGADAGDNAEEHRDDRAPSRLLGPHAIRVAASAMPFDVLVCTDRVVALDALPLFKEVHLLDPVGIPVRLSDDDALADDLAIHCEPVAEALTRLSAELSGMRILFAIAAEYDPLALRTLGPGSALLCDGPLDATGSAWAGDSDREIADLGIGTAVAPPALVELLRRALESGLGGTDASTGNEVVLALQRSEGLVKRLRDRNSVLEDRIAALRYELEATRGAGAVGRLGLRLRKLRARLRPIVGVRLGLLWHHRPRPLRIPKRYARAKTPSPAPSISLVVPSYNQGGFIGRTLESVISQEYPELEIIIQDGGSTDQTLSVVEGYRSQIAHLESAPDGGQAAAINTGFRRSTGEIMAWLNSDDILLPGALAYVAGFLAENPDVDLVYGHRVLIDSDDAEIGRWVMPAHDPEILSWADFIPQETMFWRREAWEKAGGTLTEEYRFALDWELLVRMRDSGAKIVRLPRFIGGFRVHEAQKSSAQVDTVGNGEMDRLRRRIHGRRIWPRETHKALRPYLRRHNILDKLHRLGLLRH